MGTAYLLDSNIVIYLINGTLTPKTSSTIAEASESVAYLSVVTKIEVLGWNPPLHQEADEYSEFVEDSIIIGLSDEIVDKTIEIRRATRIKLPDAIIAATALVNNLTLLTRNILDFSNIPGMKVINPFQ